MTTNSQLLLQTNQNKGLMLSMITQAASTDAYDRMTVLVAYATKLGCEILTTSLEAVCPNWLEMHKTWIISLDFGHTQPAALEYLARLPNSYVAIPNAELVLKAKLKPPIRFHPKLYLFQSTIDPNAIAILSGSCNLTRSGLYLNTEQATISIFDPTHPNVDDLSMEQFATTQKVIQEVCESASPLTKKILAKYRSLWHPSYLPSVEKQSSKKIIAHDPSIDMDKALALSTASNFWVKVTPKVVQNRGPGKPGNQIDMQRGARVFFGFDVKNVTPNTTLGPVTMSFEGSTSQRSLWYAKNSMDKIRLPPLQPPRTYANRVLLFHRKPNGFDLVIGTAPQASHWRNLSTQQKTIYQMKGGRQFGVFE